MPRHCLPPKWRQRTGPPADAVECLGMPKDSSTSLRDPPASRATSPSEEMYLITVALAEERGGEERLAVAALAQDLSISPVSANQMVWRLAGRGLMATTHTRGWRSPRRAGQRPGACCAVGVCGGPSWWVIWALERRRRTRWPATSST